MCVRVHARFSFEKALSLPFPRVLSRCTHDCCFSLLFAAPGPSECPARAGPPGTLAGPTGTDWTRSYGSGSSKLSVGAAALGGGSGSPLAAPHPALRSRSARVCSVSLGPTPGPGQQHCISPTPPACCTALRTGPGARGGPAAPACRPWRQTGGCRLPRGRLPGRGSAAPECPRGRGRCRAGCPAGCLSWLLFPVLSLPADPQHRHDNDPALQRCLCHVPPAFRAVACLREHMSLSPTRAG